MKTSNYSNKSNMQTYESYHRGDSVLIEKFDSHGYCNNLTDEEKTMVPFLSFPVIKDCNFSCLYCGRDGEATASTVEFISYQRLKTIVEAAINLNVRKFRLTGGEPFLHPDIATFLRYFNSIRCYTLVNTNGSRIMNNADVIGELDSNFIKFAISLDSLNESRFNKIARPLEKKEIFQEVLAGIDYLSSNGFLLRINMVVGTHNIDEVEDMIQFCQVHHCDLKLLDIVSVPVPFGKRSDYFVDLTDLEVSLEKKCDCVISHVYTKSFGVPCVKYKFGNTRITVKNGTKGTHYDKEGICCNCRYFPCHEGLYDIFALPDGRICPCRWSEQQRYDSTSAQLEYLIKAFQRANFYSSVNNIRVDMQKREDLL